MNRASVWRAAAIGLTFLAAAGSTRAADKLKALIVEGQNNHPWQTTTPILKAGLERTGRFEAKAVTSPPAKSPASAWDGFRPDFQAYDVVLTNYNGEPWPEPVRKGLEEYVAKGGGLVVLHAANNAFPEWPAYNQMIGLGWRDARYGDRITVDDAGRIVRTPKGEGPGAGHGPRHAYNVVARKPDHPILKGLPTEWLHSVDELYHGQRGPANDMDVLATAFSDASQKGTGAHEPMLWTIPFGQGRVVTNVMGHVVGDDTSVIEASDFQTLLARSAEWAATGAVTLPPPAKFTGAAPR